MELNSQLEQHRKTFLGVIDNPEFSIENKRVSAEAWFSEVLDILSYVKQNSRRVYFIGNGASCSMASHFATDFTKNGGIPSLSLNEGTMLTCFSNDFSYETAYMEMLRRHIQNSDALVAISTSGKSPNILHAAEFVKNSLAKSAVITFSGFNRENPLFKTGTYNLYLNSNDYGFVESGHAYYLHLLLDFFIQKGKKFQ